MPKMKVDSVKVVDIRQVDEPPFGWVRVEITFYDAETDAYPSLSALVPIKFRPDWTLARIQKAACEAATNLACLYAERPSGSYG